MMMSRSVYRLLCLDSVCLCVSQVKSNVDIVSASRLLLPIRILTWQKDFGLCEVHASSHVLNLDQGLVAVVLPFAMALLLATFFSLVPSWI